METNKIFRIISIIITILIGLIYYGNTYFNKISKQLGYAAIPVLLILIIQFILTIKFQTNDALSTMHIVITFVVAFIILVLGSDYFLDLLRQRTL